MKTTSQHLRDTLRVGDVVQLGHVTNPTATITDLSEFPKSKGIIQGEEPYQGLFGVTDILIVISESPYVKY